MTRRYEYGDDGRMQSNDVEVALDHLGESASGKAWKVRDGDGKIHWLPKSQCTMDSDPRGAVFLMPEWLAKEKGLI